MTAFGVRLPVLALGLLATACSDDTTTSPGTTKTAETTTSSSPWFQDVATESGIDFTWQSSAAGDYNLPEIIGGGVALLDYDQDGDLDVYLVQGGDLISTRATPPSNTAFNRLYRNDGNMSFIDVTEATGAGDPGYGMGVATGDYDNDGDVDLYITNVGRNTLLRNDGDRFSDVTDTAGVGDRGWGTAAMFVDYDRDGDLDLYASNYLVWSPETEITCQAAQGGEDYCAPGNYPVAAPDRLYRNRGDGTFEDASETAGITTASRTGLGIAAGDYDGDGHVDLFVANDGMPDLMWRNQGDGRFVDVGLTMGCAIDNDGKEKAGMGVGSTDLDDDGDLDLIVCNLVGESDSIFRNEGTYFIDTTARTGVKAATSAYTRFGLGWLDFDNDGWLDLYEATGRVQRSPESGDADPYAEEDVLMRGDSSGRFTLVSPMGGTTSRTARTSRAAAFGDLDNDGRLDVVVVNRDAAANVYRNISAAPGHWVLIRALDDNGRDALGGMLSARVGQRRLTRPIQTAYSYFAANDPRVHLGLGTASTLEDVSIRWPDGVTEHFGSLPVDRIHTLQRGNGQPNP